ncbi:meiosis 1 arrest protein-like isoform X3 [Biomphalaria glabrata]|uniref:Meiosis 1 arrest protein-like isoform X3 n=1 Tax=Biomphalaria glabrata TaxID=6526 RepID=A0A9W3BP14_BIOGL|nr:meiosis 1 arrest protein-like isoform X3 [Biomphalaria glabrata]
MAFSTKKVDINSRRIIGFHCARVILLDVTAPFEKQAGISLTDALENVLCICGKMEGPSRIPLISIYLLKSKPQQILPFSCTKSNFVNLHGALTELRTFLHESLADFQLKNEESCLQQGLTEACSDYKRYLEGFPQAPHNFSKLEMIVFTGHSGQHVQSQFEAASQQLNISVVKRVVSATIRSSLITHTMMGGSPGVPSSEDTTGLVDVILLDCDPYSLQNFFYLWLNETSKDSEHIQLLLPPPSPADSELIIKCDLLEQMLSPYQLPFCEAFDLHTESVSCKHVYPTASKAVSMTVPVKHLKAVGCIPLSKLCDSAVFGLSLIVLPTSCWKLDWEEIERNHSHYTCLCNELLTKDVALLTKLVYPSVGSQPKEWSSSRTSQAIKPSGYFVLMPSENSILVKSVISRELLIPFIAAPSEEKLDEVAKMRVQSSLSMVETIEDFNPLYYESGLWDALKHISLPKSAVDRALINRKKAVLLQNKPNSWVQAFNPPASKSSK